jgi:hypothetical protein
VHSGSYSHLYNIFYFTIKWIRFNKCWQIDALWLGHGSDCQCVLTLLRWYWCSVICYYWWL